MDISRSTIIVVLGLLFPVCETRRCYHCNGEKSLQSCDLQTCNSGPECHMSISENSNGVRSYYAKCTTESECRSLNSGHHSSSRRVCEGCCYTDECVPEDCQGYQPYKLHEGVTCEQCSGGDCGVYPGSGPEWKCEDTLPYCLNIVQNSEDGSKHVTKSCGSQSDCDSLWWNDSRNKKICQDFDPSNIYPSNFTCSYCCMTEHCNRDIKPAQETLYIN